MTRCLRTSQSVCLARAISNSLFLSFYHVRHNRREIESYFLSDAIATLLEGEDGDEGVEGVEEGGEGLWGPKALGALGRYVES